MNGDRLTPDEEITVYLVDRDVSLSGEPLMPASAPPEESEAEPRPRTTQSRWVTFAALGALVVAALAVVGIFGIGDEVAAPPAPTPAPSATLVPSEALEQESARSASSASDGSSPTIAALRADHGDLWIIDIESPLKILEALSATGVVDGDVAMAVGKWAVRANSGGMMTVVSQSPDLYALGFAGRGYVGHERPGRAFFRSWGRSNAPWGQDPGAQTFPLSNAQTRPSTLNVWTDPTGRELIKVENRDGSVLAAPLDGEAAKPIESLRATEGGVLVTSASGVGPPVVNSDDFSAIWTWDNGWRKTPNVHVFATNRRYYLGTKCLDLDDDCPVFIADLGTGESDSTGLVSSDAVLDDGVLSPDGSTLVSSSVEVESGEPGPGFVDVKTGRARLLDVPAEPITGEVEVVWLSDAAVAFTKALDPETGANWLITLVGRSGEVRAQMLFAGEIDPSITWLPHPS